MNYDDFIDRVNDKVRTDDEWPTSGSVTQEQVDISFIAGLAVAATLPLSVFSSADFTTQALSSPTTVYKRLERFDMPTDVFRYRDDLGITSILIDGFEFSLNEAIPINLLRAKAQNELYQDATLFSADTADRRVTVLAVDEDVELKYLPEFSKPATADIGSTAYPLEGTHAEQAASVAATHALGELRRDNAGAQFQAILERQYQTHRSQAPVAEEQEQGS